MKQIIQIDHFYDPETATLTYLVYDDVTKDALVIDPVMDYDAASGRVSRLSCAQVEDAIHAKKLNLQMILETHAHADHLSGSQILKKSFPHAQIAISERIVIVQETFKDAFHLQSVKPNGADFDLLLKDGEVLQLGSLKVGVIPTPGHTPACTSFLIGDNLFTGDALFMPDYGTGRCDFPKGSANELYSSIQRLYELPDSTKIFTGHDYLPNGRELRFQSTIGESKEKNIHIRGETSREEYVAFRTKRDATLKAPKLLFPSLQVNIMAGHLPEAESNGRSYLKTPLNLEGLK